MKPKGTVVVDEVILGIKEIRFRNGEIRITATGEGPLPSRNVHEYLVFGEDGSLIAYVKDLAKPFFWADIEEDERLVVDCALIVTENKVARGLKEVVSDGSNH